MKSILFWVVMPCSAVEVHLCFRGMYRLHGFLPNYTIITPPRPSNLK
jgi:hypothetical protein